MKVLIVEDEFYTRKGLITMIEGLEKDLTIAGQCGTVKEALTLTNSVQPDLVLLDIDLPDGNAFDFLEEAISHQFQVIFITAYDHFAIKAIKNGAIDYILKPVVPEDLEIALDKAIDRCMQQNSQADRNTKRDKLFLSFNDCIQVVSLRELMYCESDNGYTTFYLSTGQSFLSSKPLKDFGLPFLDANFVRTHQSFIVNLDFVDRYQKDGYCILTNQQKVPVSVRRKKQFMDKLMQ